MFVEVIRFVYFSSVIRRTENILLLSPDKYFLPFTHTQAGSQQRNHRTKKKKRKMSGGKKKSEYKAKKSGVVSKYPENKKEDALEVNIVTKENASVVNIGRRARCKS